MAVQRSGESLQAYAMPCSSPAVCFATSQILPDLLYMRRTKYYERVSVHERKSTDMHILKEEEREMLF